MRAAGAGGAASGPARPQRIVTVSYYTPFQLQAVGVQPVGAFDYSALADQLTEDQRTMLARTTLIGSVTEVDLEQVAAVEQDLLVGEVNEIDRALYDKQCDRADGRFRGHRPRRLEGDLHPDR